MLWAAIKDGVASEATRINAPIFFMGFSLRVV